MAAMTLLEMTQNILSAMDSDDVNTISETVESAAVATIIKETYMRLMSSREWPFLQTVRELTAISDIAQPTLMKIPTGVNKIYWVKYNKKDVRWLPVKDFVDIVFARAPLAGAVDVNGFVINRDPIYFTCVDDNYLRFDSYDSAADSSLQASKSVVAVLQEADWIHDDDFVSTYLPEKFYPTLLADAKGTCFMDLKQQANAKEESIAKRGRVQMQKEVWRVKDAIPTTNSTIDYGRK